MPNQDVLVYQPGHWDKAFKPGLTWLKQDVLVNLSVHNVRKLHFQANICKAFVEDKIFV